LRSWRVWWLALAVVAGPQLALVHALSHLSGSTVLSASSEEQKQSPEKACDSCLAFAHLGQALTSDHAWFGPSAALPAPRLATPQGTAARTVAHFQARAPPVLI
jgi:hypothetical protein